MQDTELTSKRQVAEGTILFSFRKPDGFSYQAGQSIDLTLVAPRETDTEGNVRTFSIASAPHEPELAIVMRMRDTAFKRSIALMEPGVKVRIEGPFGSFVLHEDAARPAALLAGGIGITPLRAMVRDAAERMLPHPLFLFYANRRPEDAAFLVELAELARDHAPLSFIPTMTGLEKSAEDWSGEQGRVDASMLARHLPAGSAPLYYLAGPQGMTLAMRDMLITSGVSRDDIRYEEFAGY